MLQQDEESDAQDSIISSSRQRTTAGALKQGARPGQIEANRVPVALPLRRMLGGSGKLDILSDIQDQGSRPAVPGREKSGWAVVSSHRQVR